MGEAFLGIQINSCCEFLFACQVPVFLIYIFIERERERGGGREGLNILYLYICNATKSWEFGFLSHCGPLEENNDQDRLVAKYSEDPWRAGLLT